MATKTSPNLDAKKPVKKKSARKKLYQLHTWVGFHLAAIMTLVLFTGTIAVISNEIDWLIQHDMRVSPDSAQVSWSEMEEAARTYRLGDALTSLSAMQGDHFAYRARMIDEYGRHYFLHVNQWTGEVTGTTHPLTVQRFFRDIHRYLFMPNFIGLPLVTSLAFILGISLYTGLKTARNWGTIATRVRTDKGLRIAIGDSHKAAGIWGIWFFVVIIVTSIWYLAEFGGALGGQRFEPSRPKLTQERADSFGAVIRDANADDIIAAAKAAFPELRPRSISFATGARSPITVMGRKGNILLRDRANKVYLDPVDLSVIHVQRAENIGWVAYLNAMADPLHFGYFGGLPTKIIWFIFGAAMTGLSVTGVWLTWKRLKTAAPTKTQFATMPVLLAMMAFGVGWYERQQGPDVPNAEKLLYAQTLQGFEAALALALDADGAPTGLVRLTLSSEKGRPNVKHVAFGCEVGEGPVTTIRRLAPTIEARAELPTDALLGQERICARIHFHSGEDILAEWTTKRSRPPAPNAEYVQSCSPLPCVGKRL